MSFLYLQSVYQSPSKGGVLTPDSQKKKALSGHLLLLLQRFSQAAPGLTTVAMQC